MLKHTQPWLSFAHKSCVCWGSCSLSPADTLSCCPPDQLQTLKIWWSIRFLAVTATTEGHIVPMQQSQGEERCCMHHCCWCIIFLDDVMKVVFVCVWQCSKVTVDERPYPPQRSLRQRHSSRLLCLTERLNKQPGMYCVSRCGQKQMHWLCASFLCMERHIESDSPYLFSSGRLFMMLWSWVTFKVKG